MIYRLQTPTPVLHQDGGGPDPPGGSCANFIDENTSGWNVNDDAVDGNRFLTDRLFYIPEYDKVISYGRRTSSGDKDFHQILEIDATDMSITNAYVHQVTGFSEVFNGVNKHFWNRDCYAKGKYIILVYEDDNVPHVLVINHVAGTFWEYHFGDLLGTTQNVAYTWDIGTEILIENITPWIDTDTDTLYLCRHGSNVTFNKWEVITTDLTAIPSLGFYTFTNFASRPLPNNAEDSADNSYVGFYPEENRFIIATNPDTATATEGHIWVNRIDTGASVKQYRPTDNTDMWFWGASGIPVIKDDIIYAPITYSTNQSQGSKRGLMRIDMDDDSIDFIRPTYNDALDNYALRDAQLISNTHTPSIPTLDTILFASDLADPNGGIALYNITSGIWEYWTTDNVNCYLDADQAICVAYDSSRGRIICSNSEYDAGNQATRERIVWF